MVGTNLVPTRAPLPSHAAPIDDPGTRPQPPAWRARLGRGAFVALTAGALVGVTLARLTDAASLFLSPDGGHYLTDARALAGGGVRALAHPPAFPALVAATDGLVSAVGQVQLALGVSLWL